MSFVKLSIFGTSFEVGFILLSFHLSHKISGHNKICRSPTRWHGCVIHSIIPPFYPTHPLQGAFGLVWYVDESSFPPSYYKCPLQFRKGSTHRRIRCYQEDHETLQHSCPLETYLSRAETPQAHPTRKRSSSLTSSTLFPPTNSLSRQIISLSDVFISPLEDMWVSIPPCPSPPLIPRFCQLFRD